MKLELKGVENRRESTGRSYLLGLWERSIVKERKSSYDRISVRTVERNIGSIGEKAGVERCFLSEC